MTRAKRQKEKHGLHVRAEYEREDESKGEGLRGGKLLRGEEKRLRHDNKISGKGGV